MVEALEIKNAGWVNPALLLEVILSFDVIKDKSVVLGSTWSSNLLFSVLMQPQSGDFDAVKTVSEHPKH